MKILAFDNSTATCTVALQDGSRIKTLAQTAPMLQAKLILPLIDKLLKDFALTLHDLDAIAYGCGPGSFTGIRITSSVAQGLGYGANIRLLPISSLALLAQTAAPSHAERDILLAVDARMGQIYWAHYKVNDEGLVELMGEEQLRSPNDIKNSVDTYTSAVCRVGDGWQVYADQLFKHHETTHPTPVPDGHALLKLAKNHYSQPNRVKIMDAVPVYLR